MSNVIECRGLAKTFQEGKQALQSRRERAHELYQVLWRYDKLGLPGPA